MHDTLCTHQQRYTGRANEVRRGRPRRSSDLLVIRLGEGPTPLNAMSY